MLAIKKKFGKTLLDLVIAIPAASVYACVLNCFFKLQFAIDSPFCYRFIYICKQPRGNISTRLLHQRFFIQLSVFHLPTQFVLLLLLDCDIFKLSTIFNLYLFGV